MGLAGKPQGSMPTSPMKLSTGGNTGGSSAAMDKFRASQSGGGGGMGGAIPRPDYSHMSPQEAALNHAADTAAMAGNHEAVRHIVSKLPVA